MLMRKRRYLRGEEGGEKQLNGIREEENNINVISIYSIQ